MIENQDTVGQWLDTLIPDRTIQSTLKKLAEEVGELQEAADSLGKVGSYQNIKEESADCIILLNDLAYVMGFNLMDEVNTKMKINRKREWNFNGDGTMSHK
jgi:NTP pyrophosphatase (non-canonical NTP hydrolase)